LDKYKLRYESPRIKKGWISVSAVKKLDKEAKKAAKAKSKADKEPMATKIDIRTYFNGWTIALPVAVSLATVRGTTALVINIACFETTVTVKRVKR